jgi:hypothetical protein
VPASRHGAITAVVCIALAAVVAAMSSLNVALPDIARSTHASQTQPPHRHWLELAITGPLAELRWGR